MTTTQKLLLSFGVSALLFLPFLAVGSTLQGYQGGTGQASTTAGNVGKALIVASTSPFLTYTFGNAGGAATTTINQVVGPTFTFSIVNATSESFITTSTASLFLNILRYSSSSDITITPTGTIKFASLNISQFTNDSGYITDSSVSSTYSAQGSSITTRNLTIATSGPLLSATVSGNTLTLTSAATSTILAGYSTSTGANPTAIAGLSVNNGSANTFMRSDASPPISQVMQPIWTGFHQFSSAGASTTQLWSSSSTLNGTTYIPTALDANGNKYVTSTQAGTGTLASTTPWTSGNLVVASSGNKVATVNGNLADCSSGSKVIQTLSASGTPTCVSGGSGTPGGSTGQVQYNEGGAFAGSSTWVFATSTKTVNLYGISSSTELRTPSATLSQAYDSQGNKYVTSTTAVNQSLQWIMESPSASEDDAIFTFPANATITQLYSVNKYNESSTFNWIWCASRNTASSTCSHLFASNVTSTASTTPDSYPSLVSFASTTVPAGSVLRYITSAASTTQVSQTIWYQTAATTLATPKPSIQWIIESPTASEDDAVFTFYATSTITSLTSVNKYNESSTFNWIWCSSRTAASSTCNHLFSANTATTASTTPDSWVAASFASTTVNANSVLRFITSAASTTQLMQTLTYTIP